ncbi:MAG: glycosyl hydrolase family 8 [candidate division NC10 bacterium]
MTLLVVFDLILFLVAMAACAVKEEVHPAIRLIPTAWNGYVRAFIEPDGRVHRPLHHGDTVSEGQAYALLMASLLEDRKTFDRVMDWTEYHLSRKEQFGDHLLAWHWESGKGVTDWNSASDADVDYALALILAHRTWGDEAYLHKAQSILADILQWETAVVDGKRYLLPGTWGYDNGMYVLNPSYFSPAHFRIFGEVTGDVRWVDLTEGGYHLILKTSRSFDGRSGVGLVPDWIAIGPDGNVTSAKGFSDRFGWDAIRLPWRVGLDYFWFQEARAKQYMQTLLNFYVGEWTKQDGTFYVEYSYEGDPVQKYESPAGYAMSLAAFAAGQSPLLTDVLTKIKATYNDATNSFKDKDNYYENSLTLLGLVFLNNVTTTPMDPRIK